MRLIYATFCALWVASLAPTPTAFRVLGLFPFNAASHNIFYKAMMEALAERGHQVTMLSPFPLKTPRANYTDIDFSKEMPSMTSTFKYNDMTDVSAAGTIFGLMDLMVRQGGNEFCRKVFRSQQVQDVLSGKYGQFDVMLSEVLTSDCIAAVAHKLKVPLIGMTSLCDMPWMHDRVGSVDNPSYIGNVMGNYFGKMNFLQRVRNVYWWIVTSYTYKTKLLDGEDEVVREFFGSDTPPLAEIVKNTSLILVNRHVSIHRARPTPPTIVNVGGLHVRASAREHSMDPELRRWLDQAEDGVILFSMGSLLRATTLPKAFVETFARAFAGLPQRVLWKFEDDIPHLPANVRIEKWLPQAEVLAHPNVILFITHGGLMGTSEALVAGVPMLGIPLFADQMTNMDLYESLGIAKRLNHWEINKDDTNQAIRHMTEKDNRYLRRAREVSSLYMDRPLSVEAEAVWWVEYVVRHRGAPHLRPLGADLPWYQYLLLDVAAAALAVAALVLFSLCRLAAVAAKFLGPRLSGVWRASKLDEKLD